MANKSIVVACVATDRLELMKTILDNLYRNSSYDEADRIIEEVNFEA